MTKLLPNWIHDGKWFACGGNASLNSVSMAWKNVLDRVALERFPPELVVQIKAIACGLPAKYGIPLSRWSAEDIVNYVRQSGLVATISGSTVWRWLHEDAIKPWQHRCWIFPRDPNFAAKAGRILDLYQRVWKGRRLKEDLVAGVYATKPGVLLTDLDIDADAPHRVPLGVVGVIPTKVSAENGAIHRGDLLVTAATPAHAMKAGATPAIGTVLGKALQDFAGPGTGVINVLVNVK